ncbi:MAG: putative bifunctional diguanylate cyclase/phosphodiesterase [Dehalococcoidia bacterium]
MIRARSLPPTLLAGLALLASAMLILGPLAILPEGQAELAVADLSVAAAAFVASACAFSAARKQSGAERRGWLLLGAGLSIWTLAEVVWSFYDLVLLQDPFPSLADVFYLGAAPPLLVGVTILSSPGRIWAQVRSMLDGGAITLLAAGLLWHFMVLPAYGAGGTTVEVVFSVAYPLIDIALVAIAALVLFRVDARGSLLLQWLVIGAISGFVVADVGFAWQESRDGYAPGWVDVLWFSGYGLLALAGVLAASRSAPERAAAPRPVLTPLAQQLVPMAVPLIAVPFLVSEGIGAQFSDDWPSFALAAGSLVVFLARQAVGAKDNFDMQAQLSGFNVALEHKVEERSSELRRLVAVLDNTTDLVCTVSPAGSLLSLNQAGRRVLGLRADEEEGRDIFGLVAGGSARTLQQRALAEASTFGFWEGELELLTAEDRAVPFSTVVLAHRDQVGAIEYYSMIGRDISEQKAYEAHLSHLASHDALTGIPNRRQFQERIERRLDALTPGESLAVVYVDLDNFKSVNDVLGHAAGDDLLMALVGVLQRELAPSDLLARLGGDEFALLLPGRDRRDALSLMEAILVAVRSQAFVIGGQPVRVTASAGIAMAPDDGADVSTLMARADIAMYRAKRLRDRVCAFEAGEDSEEALDRARLMEMEIAAALRDGRLRLFGQAIRPVHEGGPVHVEALLRIVQADGSLSLPSDFIPVAERSGLIRMVDREVTRLAVEFLARRPAEAPEMVLHVNLSASALEDDTVLEFIGAEVERTRIDPASLVFEITETAAVTNVARARSFIQRVKALGCRFALDDFGVGYSSISHLKNLDIDFLKIDGSLVTNVVRDVRDQHLIRAIVELAHGLGKTTVAEFVGDAATFAMLERLGVEFGQGFYLGVPRPIADFATGVTALRDENFLARMRSVRGRGSEGGSGEAEGRAA